MIKLSIPATSANLGPGFDTIGMALNLSNRFCFRWSDRLIITGCDKQYAGSDNLAYRAFCFTLKELGHKVRPVAITIDADIPIARGLGSSSTLILAGVISALELTNTQLEKAQIIDLAMRLEGHPDNIAPALYGGVTISVVNNDRVITEKLPLTHQPQLVAFIPNFALSTEQARQVLPQSLSYAQSIYNTGRAALLTHALLNRRYDLLRYACDDAIHQPYRKALIANYSKIFDSAYQQGAYAVYLSGAGPTILSFVEEAVGFIEKTKPLIAGNWQLVPLTIDDMGTVIERSSI